MKFPVRLLIALFSCLCILGLSCSSKSDDVPRSGIDPTDTLEPKDTTTSIALDAVIFTVIGDVPYNVEQRNGLVSMIQRHNTISTSEFVVHVGDIKSGADPCNEAVYQDVSGLLREFSAPTFMLLGDNEYNDCHDPYAALQLWNQYLLNFHQNWNFNQIVNYQENRTENFAWVQEKVMFMGLNLVGSKVHDDTEWNERLSDNSKFLRTFVSTHGEDSRALVLFGHANMIESGAEKFKPFTDILRATAKAFDKPILYLQGDGHFYYMNRPYDEQNILRVQIEGGATAVQVTVDPNLDQPFSFDRNFLN